MRHFPPLRKQWVIVTGLQKYNRNGEITTSSLLLTVPEALNLKAWSLWLPAKDLSRLVLSPSPRGRSCHLSDVTSCTSLIWLFGSDALQSYLWGYSEQGQDKGPDFDQGAPRLLAWTLAWLWLGHGAVGSRAKGSTCMQISVWEGLVVAMAGTWLTNWPRCLLFASVDVMGGWHFVLGAVQTQSGGKSSPWGWCSLPPTTTHKVSGPVSGKG